MLNLENYNFDENESNVFANMDKLLLTINGVDLSGYVTEFSYVEYDISTADSGLDDTGFMHNDTVAEDKRKLTIKWSGCPSAYKKKIKAALKQKPLNATWVVGDDKESITVESYKGDRTFTMKKNKDNKIYWDISTSIIGLGGE